MKVKFKEYRDLCEKSGWSYCCCIQNLVIFSSAGAARPTELQTDWNLALETLQEVTLKMEKAFLVEQVKGAASMVGIMAIMYVMMAINIWYGESKSYRMTGMLILTTYVATSMIPVLAYYLGYRKLENSIKEKRKLPDRGGFWDWENLSLASFLLLGIIMALIYFCYSPGRLGIGYAGSGAIILLACLFLFFNWRAANGFSFPNILRGMGRKKLTLLSVIFSNFALE